jgi:hypothetical protein
MDLMVDEGLHPLLIEVTSTISNLQKVMVSESS